MPKHTRKCTKHLSFFFDVQSDVDGIDKLLIHDLIDIFLSSICTCQWCNKNTFFLFQWHFRKWAENYKRSLRIWGGWWWCQFRVYHIHHSHLSEYILSSIPGKIPYFSKTLQKTYKIAFFIWRKTFHTKHQSRYFLPQCHKHEHHTYLKKK